MYIRKGFGLCLITGITFRTYMERGGPRARLTWNVVAPGHNLHGTWWPQDTTYMERGGPRAQYILTFHFALVSPTWMHGYMYACTLSKKSTKFHGNVWNSTEYNIIVHSLISTIEYWIQ